MVFNAWISLGQLFLKLNRAPLPSSIANCTAAATSFIADPHMMGNLTSAANYTGYGQLTSTASYSGYNYYNESAVPTVIQLSDTHEL